MWLVASAVMRDLSTITTDLPGVWREIRRFNLPVKLAVAAAHRVAPRLTAPGEALLVGLAPCRPGSPELNKITRDLDVGFDDPLKAGTLRVNPIYTMHAIDNLGISALAIALANDQRCANFGGAAGQAWVALEHVLEQDAAEALVFGGDQTQASWRGEPDPANELGVALAFAKDRRDSRIRLVAIERADAPSSDAVPHAAHGLVSWLAALESAPPGVHRYAVPPRDGDAIDPITVVAEVL
jgi:hypothetical protein